MSDDQELKSAYRKLALKYHPDRNPGDQASEEKFKAGQRGLPGAERSRTSARLTTATGMRVSAVRAVWLGGPFAGGVDIGDIFGDLFGEMFSVGGGSQRGSRQKRGDDLRFDLAIDFEDAFFGAETEVRIRRLETCTVCKGRGSASGRGPSVCPQCQGRGQIRYQQGFFSVARTCGACGGAGPGDRRSVHRPAAAKRVWPRS